MPAPMRPWMRTAFVLLLILLLSTVFFALLYRSPERGPPPPASLSYHEVTCSPQGVNPASIEVTQGVFFVLNVTAHDEEHVFSLLEYGISHRVPAGETVTLGPVQATLVGTFPYTCTTGTPATPERRGAFVVHPAAEPSPPTPHP